MNLSFRTATDWSNKEKVGSLINSFHGKFSVQVYCFASKCTVGWFISICATGCMPVHAQSSHSLVEHASLIQIAAYPHLILQFLCYRITFSETHSSFQSSSLCSFSKCGMLRHHTKVVHTFQWKASARTREQNPFSYIRIHNLPPKGTQQFFDAPEYIFWHAR